jgi:nicotinamidase-related amidase
MMNGKRSALVVVDVENGFITKDSAPVVPVIVDLVRRWRGDVVFTRYHNYPGSPYEQLIGWYGLHEQSERELVSELATYAGEHRSHIIDKNVYTALTDEGEKWLADNEISDLYICGIATDGCVLKTALDAFEKGYTPWVLADACASNATSMEAAEVHRISLQLMARLVGAGQIISSEDALAMAPAFADSLTPES